MKIRIAYVSEEEKDAAASVAALLQILPDARIRRQEQKPPYRHIYITTAKPLKDPGKK